MSQTNAKALNSMRQRLRKHNLAYTEEIEKFRENPESSDEDGSADEDAESSEESGAGAVLDGDTWLDLFDILMCVSFFRNLCSASMVDFTLR